MDFLVYSEAGMIGVVGGYVCVYGIFYEQTR